MNESDRYNSVMAKRIRESVESSGLSQQKIADNVGVSRQAISQYCDGSTIPNADKLMKIAQFFGVSADYLLGLSETRTTDPNLKEICSYTGLSEKSVALLNQFAPTATQLSFEDQYGFSSSGGNDISPEDTNSFLNTVLEDQRFYKAIIAFALAYKSLNSAVITLGEIEKGGILCDQQALYDAYAAQYFLSDKIIKSVFSDIIRPVEEKYEHFHKMG